METVLVILRFVLSWIHFFLPAMIPLPAQYLGACILWLVILNFRNAALWKWKQCWKMLLMLLGKYISVSNRQSVKTTKRKTSFIPLRTIRFLDVFFPKI